MGFGVARDRWGPSQRCTETGFRPGLPLAHSVTLGKFTPLSGPQSARL